ncbi:hypothetical protein [Salmonella phage 118970_sal2]|uniref:Uncharacterized protein n=2 Tax=Epseptimavirus TaxID=2732017 RepID=A0A192Y738_9CAUD|nr:hypothetical protein BOW73_gp020 [Salmonella phage 100268_sal2]YP_009323745.1 hypothetical protein BOX13_gp016 [Salmonella phage 118970_sal2]ANH50924.1 hypothetical protein [Salmonella phage 118970_sal2]ANM45512.1 hypothetical protein [Salmonella phage 100268_sal2]
MGFYSNRKPKGVVGKFAVEERPFPPVDVEKLRELLEMLEGCHERCYSELSLNEKRVVEMFCIRSARTVRGTSPKDEVKEYRVLVMHAWAQRFAVHSLQEWFNLPAYKDFHVYEDEVMNYNELYGLSFKKTGSPMHDALNSFPDHYLPVREYRDREGNKPCFTIWNKSKTISDLDNYWFRTKEGFLGTEPLPKDLKPILPPVKPKHEVTIAINRIILGADDLTKQIAAVIAVLFEGTKSSPRYEKLTDNKLQIPNELYESSCKIYDNFSKVDYPVKSIKELMEYAEMGMKGNLMFDE